MDNAPRRPRLLWFFLACLTVVLGLSSRKFGHSLPPFLTLYAGDTLWALLVFLGFGWIRPSASGRWVAGSAALFSLLIELSQLLQMPWLQELRRIRLVALVIGHGFLWSDLLCYGVGIVLGVGLERLYFSWSARAS